MIKDRIIKAGEIYQINYYRGNFRPGIIVNDTGDSCIIAPLTTSQISLSNNKYVVRIDHVGESPVFVDLRKLTTVSKSRIIDRVGSISKSDLLNIIDLSKRLFGSGINSMQLNSYAEDEIEKTGNSISDILTKSHYTHLDTQFDIFLSHSTLDKKEVAGLVSFLQSKGYSVYVDWMKDPQLERDRVTRETAQMMRIRMKNSKTLLFAFSKNSRKSVWMPWELGYFDGMEKNIAVMPIERIPFHNKKFKGQEYLSLYDYIEQDNMSLDPDGLTVVSHTSGTLTLRNWIDLAS